MSDAPQAPGWWQASDGKWYPPQGYAPPPPPPSGQKSGCAIAALVIGIVVGIPVLIAVISILAITFLGRSTSEKLSNLGSSIEERWSPPSGSPAPDYFSDARGS